MMETSERVTMWLWRFGSWVRRTSKWFDLTVLNSHVVFSEAQGTYQ